jgi:hypothetical protein
LRLKKECLSAHETWLAVQKKMRAFIESQWGERQQVETVSWDRDEGLSLHELHLSGTFWVKGLVH